MATEKKDKKTTVPGDQLTDVALLLRVALYANFSVVIAIVFFVISFSFSPFQPILALQVLGLIVLIGGLVLNVVLIARRHPEWLVPRVSQADKEK